MKNRRKHTRLPLQVRAVITLSNGFTCTGFAKNISFSGIYLECDDTFIIQPGERCSAVLTFTEKNDFVMKFQCEVVHGYGPLVALKFISHDDDEYYERFLNLIIVSSSDPEAIKDELEKNPLFPE